MGMGTEGPQAITGQKPGGRSQAMQRCFPAACAHGHSCSREEGPSSDGQQPPDPPGLPALLWGKAQPPSLSQCEPAAAHPGRARAGLGCQSPANAPLAAGSSWLGTVLMAVVGQQPLPHVASGLWWEASAGMVSLQEHYRHLPWREVFKAVVFAAHMLY